MSYSALILAGGRGSCLGFLEKALPISRLNVNYVTFEEIGKIDPDLITFMNINTYEDVEK